MLTTQCQEHEEGPPPNKLETWSQASMASSFVSWAWNFRTKFEVPQFKNSHPFFSNTKAWKKNHQEA